ncbi:MAG: hypothetical protein WD669_11340 [Pirellulales bacterium]
MTAFEQQLVRMSPAALRLDRDRLMFDAGRASALAEPRPGAIHVARGTRFWPATAAMMTAASIVLAILLIRQSPPAERERDVARPNVALSQPAAPVDPQLAAAPYENNAWFGYLPSWFMSTEPTGGYLAKRHIALTIGLSALESQTARFTTDEACVLQETRATARELLEEYLNESAGTQNERI